MEIPAQFCVEINNLKNNDGAPHKMPLVAEDAKVLYEKNRDERMSALDKIAEESKVLFHSNSLAWKAPRITCGSVFHPYRNEVDQEAFQCLHLAESRRWQGSGLDGFIGGRVGKSLNRSSCLQRRD